MHKFVKNYIENKLNKPIVLELPKDRTLGHFSTPVAFSLAKELKKSPISIATDLAKELENEIFESINVVNGFINFKLSAKFLNTYLVEALTNENDFAKGEQKSEKILLEYISANPTGPLHIGHARGAIFGDALCRVGKHLGYNITTEYYVNDAGAQMGLLGLSIYLAGREKLLNLDVEYPEKYYRGEYLDDIAKLALEKFGRAIFEDFSQSTKLSEFAKDEVLAMIKEDLFKTGIVFDNFVSENSLYDRWHETKEKLLNNGGLYEKDNKIYINSTKFGDDSDRVVVRENQEPTYLAGDIIYHDDKFKRGYDKYINIWGADHHGYIPRVKAAVSLLGFDSSKLEVLLSQMVALLKGGEPYKMSKRAGNYVLMSDVRDEIGLDALRFIFLTKRSDSHMEFDINSLANNDSSNPVFYINYAHARVNQLFKKASKTPDDIYNADISTLSSDASYLIFQSLLLSMVLEDAFAKREMQKISEYLYDLASLIHRFYNEHKVIGEANENSMLKVFALAATSLRVGLKVLGIQAKEIM